MISEKSTFIGDEAFLPNYKALYRATLLKHRLAHGENASESDFIIPPVLCNDGYVHCKVGVYESACSLDENDPYFSWRYLDGRSCPVRFLKFEEMVRKMAIPVETQNRLIHLLKHVYQKWETAGRHKQAKDSNLRFDQTMELLHLTAQGNKTAIPSDLGPFLCNDDTVYARYNDVYYKIRTKEPFCFEALENDTVRTMTRDEFEHIAVQIRQSFKLLKRVPFRIIRAEFAKALENPVTYTVTDTGISNTYSQPTDVQTAAQVLAILEKNSTSALDITPIAADLSARLETLLTPQTEPSVFADFYDFKATLPNFDALYRIEQLKRAIKNQNPDLWAPENNDFEIAPIFTNDNRIHYKVGEDHFVVSLNPNNMFFSGRKDRFPRDQYPLHDISLALATDVLKAATQSDAALQQEVLTHLPTLYAYCFANKRPKQYSKALLPRFDQVLEEETLKAVLAGTPMPDDIPAIPCADEVICARYNGVYFKIKYNQNPVIEALENNQTRLATPEETKILVADLAKYSLLNHGKAFAETVRALKKSIRPTKSVSVPKSPKPKALKTVIPPAPKPVVPVSKKAVQTPDAPARKRGCPPKQKGATTPPAPNPVVPVPTPKVKSPATPKPVVAVPTPKVEALETPKPTPAQPIKVTAQPPATPQPPKPAERKWARPTRRPVRRDEDDELPVKKETATEKLRKLWRGEQTAPCSLVPFMQPISDYPPLPEDMFVLPHNEAFFGKNTEAADADVLYLTHVYQARYNLGKNTFPNKEDCLAVDINPTLCAGNILMVKKQRYLAKVSLDKNNPLFLITDVVTNTDYLMSWETVENLMKKWLGETPQTIAVLIELKPLYQSYMKTRPSCVQTTPSAHQLIYMHAMRAAHESKIGVMPKEMNVNSFSFLPTLTNDGRMILSKIGCNYYKIQLGQEVTFHRLSLDGTYLMTPQEFHLFVNGICRNNVFPKENIREIGMLLRQIYQERQESIFKEFGMGQISLQTYKNILANPNSRPTTWSGTWGRTRG